MLPPFLFFSFCLEVICSFIPKLLSFSSHKFDLFHEMGCTNEKLPVVDKLFGFDKSSYWLPSVVFET